MGGEWSPNKEIREDVTVLRRGDNVFGPLPRHCKFCTQQVEFRRPWTHVVLASTGIVTHLVRLIRPLDSGGEAKTFCDRRFRYRSL
jgi:hypothetical protein